MDKIDKMEIDKIENDRNWKFESQNISESDLDFSITLKIRGEKCENYIPPKLYCSHKYHLLQEFNFSKKIFKDLPGMIICKIRVINPKTNEEIIRKDKKIIKGVLTTGIEPIKNSSKVFKGSLRVQFTSSSYHFSKMNFMMVISYFSPRLNDEEKDKLLFELKSPLFQTFSRKSSVGVKTLRPKESKPLLKRKKNKKRKRSTKEENENLVGDDEEEEEEDINEIPLKKRRKKVDVSAPLTTYDKFLNKLSDVMSLKGKLNENEKENANEISMMKLLSTQLSATTSSNEQYQNEKEDQEDKNGKSDLKKILESDSEKKRLFDSNECFFVFQKKKMKKSTNENINTKIIFVLRKNLNNNNSNL